MRIVICDDEKNICESIQDLLKAYGKKKNIPMEIETFHRGEELRRFLGREEVDLVFLDIMLPEEDGVSVGRYIREVLEDSKIDLVYISSRTDYAMELFQNHPIDFLVKPIKKEKLFHVLDESIKKREENRGFFEMKGKNGSLQIAYRDIICFQSKGRQIQLMGRKRTETFYGKLDEVQEKLSSDVFLRIHKSFLININYIETYNYKRICLYRVGELSISTKHRPVVKERLMGDKKGKK